MRGSYYDKWKDIYEQGDRSYIIEDVEDNIANKRKKKGKRKSKSNFKDHSIVNETP